MTKLPSHLEWILSASSGLRTDGFRAIPLTYSERDQLRAILTAAVAIAEADPTVEYDAMGSTLTDCAFCWGGDDNHQPFCEHRQLKAALEAPPADATNR